MATSSQIDSESDSAPAEPVVIVDDPPLGGRAGKPWSVRLTVYLGIALIWYGAMAVYPIVGAFLRAEDGLLIAGMDEVEPLAMFVIFVSLVILYQVGLDLISRRFQSTGIGVAAAIVMPACGALAFLLVVATISDPTWLLEFREYPGGLAFTLFGLPIAFLVFTSPVSMPLGLLTAYLVRRLAPMPKRQIENFDEY